MNSDLFTEIIDGLQFKAMDILTVHNKCQNTSITRLEAQQFIYSLGREKRFELFIALYNSTLCNDVITAFQVFKEAYCMSDNIYLQIGKSHFPFELKGFLKFLCLKDFDFFSLMSEDEKKYYDNLPDHFTIYRGVCYEEYISQNYGISWSLSKEKAQNYAYFSKNNVEDGSGGLLDNIIEKKDVLTVFNVQGDYEIIYLM
jgi:hypothetical protein